MPLYDVTFVLNSVVHQHIEAKDEKELADFIAHYYGVGHDYYGPVKEELAKLMLSEISGGAYYISGFTKKCSSTPDAIAGNQKP